MLLHFSLYCGALQAAIGEAGFMTGMERNSLQVAMAAFAPLLSHWNDRACPHNMIIFDNHRYTITAQRHQPCLCLSAKAEYRICVCICRWLMSADDFQLDTQLLPSLLHILAQLHNASVVVTPAVHHSAGHTQAVCSCVFVLGVVVWNHHWMLNFMVWEGSPRIQHDSCRNHTVYRKVAGPVWLCS